MIYFEGVAVKNMETIFYNQQCHKIVPRQTFHRMREKTFVSNILCLDLPLAKKIWLKSPIIPKRSSIGSLLFPVKRITERVCAFDHLSVNTF